MVGELQWAFYISWFSFSAPFDIILRAAVTLAVWR